MSHTTPLRKWRTPPDCNTAFALFTQSEQWWADRHPFFAEHGYMLRPRYRPDWEPSWQRDPSINVLFAEDHLTMHATRPHLMDARRVSDNKLVLIKSIRHDSPEFDIATHLSSPAMRRDPCNHSVPIIDVLRDPADDTAVFIVMPFLKRIDDPPFESVGNVLDCCEQFVEGLVFMHDNGVAHRDCAYRNLMVDADPLYPRGFHPMVEFCLPDNPFTLAPVLSRRGVSLRYYYVDFGISTRYAPNEPRNPVLGTAGLDQEVPELSNDVPYDPFKVDIFILGNTFRELFLDKYSNVNMLAPLVHQMVAKMPAERPSAAEALQEFKEFRQGVSSFQASLRLRPRDEALPVTAVLTAFSLLYNAVRSVF